MGSVSRTLTTLLALLVARADASAAANCQLVREASVEMSFDPAGGVSVPMTISGRKLNLLVDTGGVTSLLSDKLVDALKLARRPINRRMRMQMFGGYSLHDYVEPRDIDFGGLHADSLTMDLIPDGYLPGDGTLAPNIMQLYDVEFDFANGRFTLFSQDHCPGAVVYWTKDAYARVSFRLDSSGHIELPVEMDGQKLTAGLDTGSSRSILSLEQAKRLFNFDDKSPGLTPVATSQLQAFRYPFKTLQFDGVAISNPDVVLVPDSVSHMKREFILGMGILRQLHLYIAYGEKELYATAASAH